MTDLPDSWLAGEPVVSEKGVAAGPRTLSERLRLALTDDIMSGKLPPGTSLDETDLASRFQVSRTPVREALRQLSAQGLIIHRPHRGAVVVDVSPDDLRLMFEVLNELEVLCAGLCAERMTAEERRRLDAMHRDGEPIVQSGQDADYATYNEQFHALIHQGTHNPFLVETVRAAKNRVAPFRQIQFRAPGRLAKSFAEHQALVDAIQRGDVLGARDQMRRHLTNSMNSYNDVHAERDASAGA